MVAFDIRDWKYLSNYKRFQQKVLDPDVLAGIKESTIEIDFSALQRSDNFEGSRFI